MIEHDTRRDIGRVIALTLDDDLAGARERIDWAIASGSQRIVLALPDQSDWRELEFARLKRFVEERKIAVAIAHPALALRLAARECGLPAFNSAAMAERQGWAGAADVPTPRRLTPPRRFKPDSLRRLFGRRNYWWLGLSALLALATVGVLVAAALVFVPTARISLTASSQPVQRIVSVVIDPAAVEADPVNRIIPARRVDVVVEDRLGVETTGKRSIPRYRAQGRVQFFNNLSTPYTVPANTVVRSSGSSNPARFVTLQPVEVPPAGRVDANVEAVDEGGIGNVGPGAINQVEGVPSLAVRVSNAAGTGGGGDEKVRAVALVDIDRAKRQLREKLFALAVEQMKTQGDITGGGLYIVPETLFIADVQDESSDRFVTEQADIVNVSTRLQVAALAVAPSDLTAVAREALKESVPKDFSLLSARAERGDASEEGTGNRVEYFVVARGVAGAEIDQSAVRKLIAGKTRAEAQTILLQEFKINASPRISLEPAWWVNYFDRIPWITLRIQTEVKRE